MRKIWLTISLLLAVAVPAAQAGEDKEKDKDKGGEAIGLSRLGDFIRDGKIDVGKQYNMNDKKGRFHLIHSEEMDLNCESCHVEAKGYAADYLLLDRDQAVAKAAGKGKGKKADILDRSVCLGCHKTGGVGTVWYQTANK
jgi:hypothetical protein